MALGDIGGIGQQGFFALGIDDDIGTFGNGHIHGMGHGDDILGIEFVELVHQVQDIGKLLGKGREGGFVNVEPGESGDVSDGFYRNGHDGTGDLEE